MATSSSCTRSLGASHPLCPGLPGSHGFTAGTLTGGVSHGAPASLLAVAAAYGAATALPESGEQGALPTGMLESGRGSAALRMNLTACGNATVPERLDTISKATARVLLEAEYIVSPARTCNSPQSALGGSLPDGRQPEARRRTVQPRSGTKEEDEVRGAKPPKTFLE